MAVANAVAGPAAGVYEFSRKPHLAPQPTGARHWLHLRSPPIRKGEKQAGCRAPLPACPHLFTPPFSRFQTINYPPGGRYREFYLDLSNQVQFPIESSLPWILIKQVVTNQASKVPLLATLPMLLDVYNDAAHRAVHSLKQVGRPS